MVITASLPGRPRVAYQNPCQQDPTSPGDHFQPARTAAGVVGAGLTGAGLGLLGARAGAYAGLWIGLETVPATAGLAEALVHSLRGAVIGQLAGAAVYGAVGVTVGYLGATALYDKLA